MRPSLAALRERLPELALRDERRLRRRLDSARRRPDAATVTALTAQVEAAEARVAARRAGVPRVTFPDLPVSACRDDISAAIRDHQVVIVAGETGSGKTTQLPKICLELGRGVRGQIGHTQPRRLAARAVAERVADELGTPLGGAVGYKVRFTDQVGEQTLIKVMTDGILLAEIAQDRQLTQYDTLIIDEAHERSLNIDFILGYLKALLPRRPDLKVIITSATIDPDRFSRHFDGAPILEVSGRTYPVEVRYRPLLDDDADRDQIQAICDAVAELDAEPPGDILVFLSGEREIRDTADALGKAGLRDTEILPLYARLSAAEQHRVFAPHAGRRIVLATNVAETSLTVPGIRYVVDPGTARISRYSRRTKVQRLPIEAISQASASQRAGRCGRLSDGICIRLYSEEDFAGRPEFTDPEILRTNLASVILQMAALGLGEITAFPFVEQPDRRNIKDGLALLRELGALDPAGTDDRPRLTPVGRKLSRLPIDPRLARMVLAAADEGCAREVMIIAAALSIRDPRERPLDKQQAADQMHARFAEPDSDFLAYLNLWRYLREQQRALSSSQFRRLCRTDFLNYLRVREWQDIYSQVRQAAGSVGISVASAQAEPARVHRALLAGLLSHLGFKDPDKQEYQGARGARFAISPGSSLFKKSPRWVIAAELVETSRLWGRIVARIDPEWAESMAEHLVSRTYSEPRWDAGRGAVLAEEKVTLYGLPIVASRTVSYGRVDPVLARELFIRHALVEGEWETRHRFFHDNRALLEAAEDLEHRARRRDIVVDDDTLFDFYDQRVGPEVVSVRHFDSWWKKTRRDRPDLLTFTPAMLVNAGAEQVTERDYPDVWQQGELRLALTYQFEPGSAADGVTVHVPLPLLHQVNAADFAWQVPGLREDVVSALIRSLPKPLRRQFVPASDAARAVLTRLTPYAEPLLPALARELRQMSGAVVPPDSWALDRLPDHLLVTFRVLDGSGATLAEGKDLDVLRRRLAGSLRDAISEAARSVERTGLRTWTSDTLDSLPRTVERTVGGHAVRGYPALVDEGGSVAVRVLHSAAEQRAAHWRGTRRLLTLNVPSPARYVHGRLTNPLALGLRRNPHGSITALFDDCVACAVDELTAAAGGPAWDAAGFAALLDAVRATLNETVYGIVVATERVLTAAHAVTIGLTGLTGPALQPSLDDVRDQLAGFVYPGFVTDTGSRRLPDVVRYLKAAERRLEKVGHDVGRDLAHMAGVDRVRDAYEKARARHGETDAVREVRWMIEELRVSLFAQTLRTPYPVSEKRILRAIDEIDSARSPFGG